MDNLPEEWRPIPGWEGLYEVSSHGRLRSLERRVKHWHGKVQVYPALMRALSWNGRYFHVLLSDRKRRKVQMVHQAVAAAFLGPCPDGHQVNHIDADKRNNHVSNLEYVTPSGNCRHAWAMGLNNPTRGELQAGHKLTAPEVLEIRRLKGQVRTGELALRFGVSAPTICDVQQRRSWRHLP